MPDYVSANGTTFEEKNGLFFVNFPAEAAPSPEQNWDYDLTPVSFVAFTREEVLAFAGYVEFLLDRLSDTHGQGALVRYVLGDINLFGDPR